MQKITLDSHCNAGERHTEGVKRPKYRKDRELHLDCHCEEGASTTKQSSGLPRYACGSARNDAECVAFTLAEVLITLTIIGVIAAMTIPNLMRKWEDHHIVVAVKESYAIVDNALKQLIREEGINDLTELDWQSCNTAYVCGKILMEKIPLKFSETKFQKIKGPQIDSQWGRYRVYSFHNTSTQGNILLTGGNPGNIAILANGMGLLFHANSSGSGAAYVDINGFGKGPNRYGYDIFEYRIAKNGLYVDTKAWDMQPSYCNKFTEAGSTSGYYNGRSCSTWVLLFGNTNYKYIKTLPSNWQQARNMQ